MASANNSNIAVEPEVLRDTETAVITAMESSTALGNNCLTLIQELLGTAFRGPAAEMAMQTMTEINTDLQKITNHGSWLAEHLGKTAQSMEASEGDSVNAIRTVLGG